MNADENWCNAEVGTEDATQFVRFNYGLRALADDASFSRIVFETIPADTHDIQELISSLDEREDAIKAWMAAADRCQLLLVCTGSDFRDLFFAYVGEDGAFDKPIRSLLTDYTGSMNARISDPDWDLFRALVAHVEDD